MHVIYLRQRRGDINFKVISICLKAIQMNMTFVCDLGVLIDVESTLKQRVSKLTSSCSCQLRRLREVRKYVN